MATDRVGWCFWDGQPQSSLVFVDPWATAHLLLLWLHWGAGKPPLWSCQSVTGTRTHAHIAFSPFLLFSPSFSHSLSLSLSLSMHILNYRNNHLDNNIVHIRYLFSFQIFMSWDSPWRTTRGSASGPGRSAHGAHVGRRRRPEVALRTGHQTVVQWELGSDSDGERKL